MGKISPGKLISGSCFFKYTDNKYNLRKERNYMGIQNVQMADTGVNAKNITSDIKAKKEDDNASSSIFSNEDASQKTGIFMVDMGIVAAENMSDSVEFSKKIRENYKSQKTGNFIKDICAANAESMSDSIEYHKKLKGRAINLLKEGGSNIIEFVKNLINGDK